MENFETASAEAPNLTPEQVPAETPLLEEKPKKKIVISVKAIVIALAVLAILILAYVFKGQFIAATVNGSLISRRAVVAELEKISGKNALESLITEKLINAEAEKKGIEVTAEEIAAEVKKIEDQIKAQGATLETALSAQGLTKEIFEKQILLNKKLEKMLVDKTGVTDEEIKQYITDNKITIPAGEETTYNEQIKAQMQQEKLSMEAGALISSLRAAAKIKYFVNY